MLCAWSPPSRHSLLGQLKNLGFLCALIYPLYVDLDPACQHYKLHSNYFELCSGICGPFFVIAGNFRCATAVISQHNSRFQDFLSNGIYVGSSFHVTDYLLVFSLKILFVL